MRSTFGIGFCSVIAIGFYVNWNYGKLTIYCIKKEVDLDYTVKYNDLNHDKQKLTNIVIVDY